jgi:hypothetical protein
MICVIVVVAIKFPKVKPVLLIGAISNKVILTKQVIVLGKRYSIAKKERKKDGNLHITSFNNLLRFFNYTFAFFSLLT